MSAPAAGASAGTAAAAAHPRFANHPGAKQAPAEALHFAPDEDKNPVMRGLPLVLASALYVFFNFVTTYFGDLAFHFLLPLILLEIYFHSFKREEVVIENTESPGRNGSSPSSGTT
jgi:hypothetical protein